MRGARSRRATASRRRHDVREDNQPTSRRARARRGWSRRSRSAGHRVALGAPRAASPDARVVPHVANLVQRDGTALTERPWPPAAATCVAASGREVRVPRRSRRRRLARGVNGGSGRWLRPTAAARTAAPPPPAAAGSDRPRRGPASGDTGRRRGRGVEQRARRTPPDACRWPRAPAAPRCRRDGRGERSRRDTRERAGAVQYESGGATTGPKRATRARVPRATSRRTARRARGGSAAPRAARAEPPDEPRQEARVVEHLAERRGHERARARACSEKPRARAGTSENCALRPRPFASMVRSRRRRTDARRGQAQRRGGAGAAGASRASASASALSGGECWSAAASDGDGGGG